MSTARVTATASDTLSQEQLAFVNATAAVLAKLAKTEAAKSFTSAEGDAIDSLIAVGIDSLVLADGTKVTLKGGLDGETSRTIDLALLAENVSAAVLKQVTKRSIDLVCFDAAVALGKISAHVASEVTSESPKKRSLVITSPIKR